MVRFLSGNDDKWLSFVRDCYRFYNNSKRFGICLHSHPLIESKDFLTLNHVTGLKL